MAADIDCQGITISIRKGKYLTLSTAFRHLGTCTNVNYKSLSIYLLLIDFLVFSRSQRVLQCKLEKGKKSNHRKLELVQRLKLFTTGDIIKQLAMIRRDNADKRKKIKELRVGECLGE